MKPEKQSPVKQHYRNNRSLPSKGQRTDFHTKILEHEGTIMSLATKDVVTLPPTTRIIDVIRTMTKKGFRRMPITDAGTKRLEGIITSFDIIDFLGGGDKNLLVEKKYKDNLLAAINAEVRTIMQNKVISVQNTENLKDAFDLMLKKNIGSIPIVDQAGHTLAICTEKDFLHFVAEGHTDRTIEEYMSKKVKTTPAETTIGEAAKIMVKNRFRRLPIVKGEILIGVVNASDIMNFLGSGDAFDKMTTGNIHEAIDEPISSLITKDVIWSSSEKSLSYAARLMEKNNIGSLPVIDDGILCGIITERDILRAMHQ